MLITDPSSIDTAELESRTGWSIRPEGACRGGVCIPVPDGPLSAATLSERLGMPIITDEEHGLVALGPASVTGRSIDAVAVPDIELEDFEGKTVRLIDVRGSRTVVVSWAPW